MPKKSRCKVKLNVVLIDCHDLWNWLGCYGRDWIRSPNIDRLIKELACFENYFAPFPQCIPSRMVIYCSRYAHTHDVYGQTLPSCDPPLFMAQYFLKMSTKQYSVIALRFQLQPSRRDFIIHSLT